METAVANTAGPVAPGGTFSVTDTVKNQGLTAARSSITQYYLSLDTQKNGGDMLLGGTRSVPKLASNAQSTGTAQVTVPTTMAAGAYYLLACADDTNVVPEGNKANNCTASGTRVTVDLPDLVEVALSNPPATMARRKSFSVSDTVWNAGAAPAGASTTQYYLSLDTQKNSSDVLLSGTRSVPALVPGLGANAFSSGTVKT